MILNWNYLIVKALRLIQRVGKGDGTWWAAGGQEGSGHQDPGNRGPGHQGPGNHDLDY